MFRPLFLILYMFLFVPGSYSSSKSEKKRKRIMPWPQFSNLRTQPYFHYSWLVSRLFGLILPAEVTSIS